MERFVEMKIAKFNILSILDCYYRLFPLIYISYDSEGIKIQGSKDSGYHDHPRDSFESFEFRGLAAPHGGGEPMVLAVPHHVRELGGKCFSISILKIDSWRVKNVFKSDNGVSYEVISNYMYGLSSHPSMDSAISFERYPATKKCLKGVDVEVSVKDGGPGAPPGGIATFRGEIFCMSTFIIGEPGQPYCMIPSDRLKLLNKFLGAIIRGSRIDFCKKDDDFLFSVDKEYYQIDIQLTTTKA